MDITVHHDDNVLVLTGAFQESALCFYEHFPENPIIPGSLIIALSLEAIETCYQEPNLWVMKYQFRHPVRPGTWTLHITRRETFICTLWQQQKRCAHGSIRTCS